MVSLSELFLGLLIFWAVAEIVLFIFGDDDDVEG